MRKYCVLCSLSELIADATVATLVSSEGVRGMKMHVDLSEHLPNFKPNEKTSALAEHLVGFTHSEWMLLKEVVDETFNTKVAKTKLDDSDELKQRLEFEFCGISKAQKAVLLLALNKDSTNLKS